MKFAEGTTVAVSKSRAEIEALAAKYGATMFSSGWMNGQAAVGFAAHGRLVRFVLALPTDAEVTTGLRKMRRYTYSTPPEGSIRDHREREERRRWRCLLLAIKAKFETVETGIETFDEAFLGHIVTADDMTLYERIKLAEVGGKRLLPPAGGDVIDIQARKGEATR